MSKIHAAKVWASCERALHEKGYALDTVTDFDMVPGLLESLEKPYLTPKMSPNMHDFTAETCFWSVLRKNGEPVAAMAARLEQLGKESVRTYWPRIMKRQYGKGELAVISEVAEPLSRELSGTLSYYGDLIIRPDYRGFGSKLQFFVRSSVILAEIEWSPEWHYAFVTERHYRSGAAATYGFTRAVPFACRWVNPPEGRGSAEACIYIPSLEFEHMLKVQASSLDQL